MLWYMHSNKLACEPANNASLHKVTITNRSGCDPAVALATERVQPKNQNTCTGQRSKPNKTMK